MSARRAAIRLSPEADRDLADILLYTQRTWGVGQRVIYRSDITQALRALRDHPQSGQPRNDLFPGCRSVRVEQHVIYYHQPQTAEVEVLRILHRRQDASTKVVEPRSPAPGEP